MDYAQWSREPLILTRNKNKNKNKLADERDTILVCTLSVCKVRDRNVRERTKMRTRAAVPKSQPASRILEAVKNTKDLCENRAPDPIGRGKSGSRAPSILAVPILLDDYGGHLYHGEASSPQKRVTYGHNK